MEELLIMSWRETVKVLRTLKKDEIEAVTKKAPDGLTKFSLHKSGHVIGIGGYVCD